MWYHRDVQVVPRVGYRCYERADDGGEHQKLAHRRIRKTGGYHRMVCELDCCMVVRLSHTCEMCDDDACGACCGGATVAIGAVAGHHVQATEARR